MPQIWIFHHSVNSKRRVSSQSGLYPHVSHVGLICFSSQKSMPPWRPSWSAFTNYTPAGGVWGCFRTTSKEDGEVLARLIKRWCLLRRAEITKHRWARMRCGRTRKKLPQVREEETKWRGRSLDEGEQDSGGGTGLGANDSRNKVYCNIKGYYQHRKSQIRWSLHWSLLYKENSSSFIQVKPCYKCRST